MWQAVEPIHAVVYFAPETRELYGQAGLKGYWMGYFASRAAAMGPVPPEVVIATFYNFHPDMVRRAIPDAWRFSSPEKVLAARRAVADAALRKVLGDEIASADIVAAAEVGRSAAEACTAEGRALYAAHASLAWPDEPHLVLWHACTLLREFRGDGHVAALVSAQIDGCEANVLIATAGVMPAEEQKKFRGWSDAEWDAARSRLQERGSIDEQGELTEQGHELRNAIEARTDQLAMGPIGRLGKEKTRTLIDEMRRISRKVVDAGALPFPNPMGLHRKT